MTSPSVLLDSSPATLMVVQASTPSPATTLATPTASPA
jgi:hypothetical protein